jgi:hypothetical protein
MRRLPAIGLLVLLAAGCSEPPQKEIDQAQGAIDTARAAGADKYAADAYNAASDALQKSRDAVGQRDYRQALSYAIDARERAHEAARDAADGKIKARRAAEAAIAATATRAALLETRLKAAETAHVPTRDLRALRDTSSDAQSALQKAGEDVDAGNYPEAVKAVDGVREKVDAAIRQVETIPRPVRKAKGKK